MYPLCQEYRSFHPQKMLIGDPQNENRIRGTGSLTHIMSDLFSLVVTIKRRILASWRSPSLCFSVSHIHTPSSFLSPFFWLSFPSTLSIIAGNNSSSCYNTLLLSLTFVFITLFHTLVNSLIPLKLFYLLLSLQTISKFLRFSNMVCSFFFVLAFHFVLH